MLDILFMSTIEALQGRKWAAYLADQSGKSFSERTFRNWMTGKSRPTPKQIRALKKAYHQNLRDILPKRGWSAAEADNYLVNVERTQGVMSAYIYSMSAQNKNSYERTFDLSMQVDELSIHLRAFRESDQLRPFVSELLNTAWIEKDHFIDPDQKDPTDENVRKQIADATHWQDLISPLAVVDLNLLMQILAKLDLEFCSKYVGGFIETPPFSYQATT